MKIRDGLVLKKISDMYVVVPTGDTLKDFSGVIRLNETGKDIYELLVQGKNEEEIVNELLNIYEVDTETLKKSVSESIKYLKDNKVLID